MIAVVAIFDKFEPAQSAKNELLASGFSWRQVQLHPDHEVAPKSRTASPQPDDQSVDATMSNLVRGLFGIGSRGAHGDLYGAAVRHGDYVLIVDTETDAGAERVRAEDILRRHQPIQLTRREV